MEIQALIRSIPKAELHLHIEGTLEPELKFELAGRNSLELPYADVEAMRAAYDFDDLPSFLEQYYEGMSVLLVEEDFYDLAMAYFERVAVQGVVYVELFFDPQAHTTRGIAFDTVMSGLRRAQRDAEARLGIRSGLIMCFLRDMPAESAAETLKSAEPYRDVIVGVGLDSDEQGNPPVKFREVFADAREQGFETRGLGVHQATHARPVLRAGALDRVAGEGEGRAGEAEEGALIPELGAEAAQGVGHVGEVLRRVRLPERLEGAAFQGR